MLTMTMIELRNNSTGFRESLHLERIKRIIDASGRVMIDGTTYEESYEYVMDKLSHVNWL